MPRELFRAYETDGKWRVRVSMAKCAPQSFRYKTVSKRKGVQALICCPKGKFEHDRCQVGMQVRTVLFPQKKYTKHEAEKSAKQFRRT